LKERYPSRSFVPISREPGTKLRLDCVEQHREEQRVDPLEETDDTFTVSSVEHTEALPLVAVVEEFLEWYEGYRGRRGKFSKGRAGTDEYESFQIPLDNSYTAGYQEKEFAEIQALFREAAGGERPTGKSCEGSFEEPATMLLSRSASSTPGGQFAPVVDHDREIADAWESVYRSMVYHADRLGLELGEDLIYHKQGEPHTGGGAASCYGHDHPVLIVDLAAADLTAQELGEELGEPMIDAHVDACESAERAAHDYTSVDDYTGAGEESCISVQRVEDLEKPGSYVSKYISNEKEDLLERDIEYIAWAASQWATNTQKAVRSNAANAAIAADACKQRAESPESKQVRGHADVVHKAAPGANHDFECVCCGSSWGIDQSPDTLVEWKKENGKIGPDSPSRSPGPTGPSVAADGGVTVKSDESESEAVKEAQLRETWQDARSVVSVGEPVGGGERVHVAFERPASWRFEAVVEQDGTMNVPSSDGVQTVELTNQSRKSVRVDRSGEEPEPVGPSEPYQHGKSVIYKQTHQNVSNWVTYPSDYCETETVRESERVYSDEERISESGPPLEPGDMMWPWMHPDGPDHPTLEHYVQREGVDLERVVEWVQADGRKVLSALLRFGIHPRYEDDLREMV
jgi:hypothetical protein